MEWASLIISICALIISIINFIYDRKIKVYKIHKNKEEEHKSKCAKICGFIIKEDRGMRKLQIFNNGLAPARNIRITDIRKTKGIILTGGLVFPYDLLNSGEHVEIQFMLSESTPPDIINIKYTWDDNNKIGNTYNQSLQL